MIYLDYNATTPVHPEVRRIIQSTLETVYGNPSSAHALGVAAKSLVEAARRQVAAAVGSAEPSSIVFTASATEANNLAILGGCGGPLAHRHVIVSAIEHPSVMEPALKLKRRGWRLSFAPVDNQGRLQLAHLEALLRSERADLVSVMFANNELGTIQPVAQAGQIAHAAGARFHVDASQALGKVPVDVEQVGADLLTLAGHKMYAPKGIGALYVRPCVKLGPILYGASQEQGLRPGTENVPYIAALGTAALLVSDTLRAQAQVARLRDELQAHLQEALPGLTVNGSQEHRLPNTLHVSLPWGSARQVVAALANEVALSTGAACHEEADGEEVTGVMRAIGASAQRARGALRISLGFDTCPNEIAPAGRLIVQACQALRPGPPVEAT